MLSKSEALKLLRSRDSATWNDCREKNPTWRPDLSGEDLRDVTFLPNFGPPFDLSGANLCGTQLPPQYNIVSGQRVANLTGAIFDVHTSCLSTLSLVSLGATFVTESQSSATQKAQGTSVFISYAWANQDVVVAFDAMLRQRHVTTYMDKRDFFAGGSLNEEILRVMRECDVVLVFYSAQAKDKPWIEFERRLALDLGTDAKEVGKKPTRLIYLVMDDTMPPADEVVQNRLHIMARGKTMRQVCEETYHALIQIPRDPQHIDLAKWDDYVFG